MEMKHLKPIAKELAKRINQEFEGELDPDTYETITENLELTDEEFEGLYFIIEDYL